MAAPIGNQFWKHRSKHGRDKLFATPELMWEAACEYFEWCNNNPLIEIDYVGKDAREVEKPKMRAFSLRGLCLYLNANEAYFRTFKAQLKDGEVGFNTIITCIEDTIYTQQWTGAAAKMLDANIISRTLGLKEQTDVTSQGEKITTTIVWGDRILPMS
jgi:hypothetical protein